jgi:hypothetical protein
MRRHHLIALAAIATAQPPSSRVDFAAVDARHRARIGPPPPGRYWWGPASEMSAADLVKLSLRNSRRRKRRH